MAVVAVTGGCRDRDPGARAAGSGVPTGCLFGVVAGGAESLRVADAGTAAALGRLYVVSVPDGGVAPGGAAGLVAESDERALAVGEQPTVGLHGGELTGARAGEQSPQPRPLGRVDQVAGGGGGDRAVAQELRGFLCLAEQGVGVDDD